LSIIADFDDLAPAELLLVIGYDGLGPLVKGLVRLALKRAATTAV
jgi:hypothetical protein